MIVYLYFCIYNCQLYSDIFERGQEKLKMAENLSDINTEDEESMRQTWHDRTAAKNITSDEDFFDTEVYPNILSPLPDTGKFSGSQLYSKKPARILATYEHSIISPKKDKMKIVRADKKKQTIIQQDTGVIAKHKKKTLEDTNEEGCSNDNVNSSNEYNKEFTTHVNKNNKNLFQKGKIGNDFF